MDRLTSAMRWLRPVAPILIVNVFAVLGQVLFGVDNYTPDTWATGWRITVAIGAAIGIESIALYVSWHAHDALLQGTPGAASRLRRWSYLIASVVAAINYSHFAPDGRPTAAAAVFGAFSIVSPWLWGLHTRRARGIQLRREGHADSIAATFSSDRWFNFPIRTLGARRYSIEHGVIDSRIAWTKYNAERAAKIETRRPPNMPADIPAPGKPASPPALVSLARPGRRLAENARTNEQCYASWREWTRSHGRPPKTRVEIRDATGAGNERAKRLHAQMMAEHATPITAGAR